MCKPTVYPDTNALAHPAFPTLGELGLFQDFVILRRMVQEAWSLFADSQQDRHETGQRAIIAISRLQANPDLTVTLDPESPLASHGDDEPITRAQRDNALILTGDADLLRKAQRYGIRTYSIYGFDQRLRAAAQEHGERFGNNECIAIGDCLPVRLVKQGRQDGQAIAYLPSGRRIIVEQAGHLIGQEARVWITNLLEGPSGPSQYFGVIVNNNDSPQVQAA
jgi:uncharacterized protein YacL